MWQARHVQSALQSAHPGLAVTLLPMTTTGDRVSQPLGGVGGKGLFVKELEEALLAGSADLAVHSMKDVTATLPGGLCLGAFLPGEDPRDAFVSAHGPTLAGLPTGARVGTSSLRRRAQLLAARPDLQVLDSRGNVGSRLQRLDEGRFDALLLACAGLKRLGLGERITEVLDADRFLPAIGQGVIGLECREGDAGTLRAIEPLNDADSATRISAERALNAALGGSCRAPVAGHAVVRGDQVELTGWVGAPDGSRSLRAKASGTAGKADQLGRELGQRLLAEGAAGILAAIGA